MLVIALGLHALLLFVPLTEPKKAPPKADEKAVKITRIPKSSNLNQPPKPVARSRPAVKRRTTPASPPAIVATPTPTPVATASPTGSSDPTKNQKPSGETGPKVDEVTATFTESFTEFVVTRTQVDGSEKAEPLRAPADAPISADLFPDPNAFFSDVQKLTKRAGLVAFDWFSPIQPDMLFNDHIARIYQAKGYSITPQGTYGGGEVYELKKGSDVRYFNVVPTGDKTGTLIMVWKNSPI